MCSQENARKSNIWPVSPSQNGARKREINDDDHNLIIPQVVRVHQHVKFEATQNDCNGNSGLESTETLMLPQKLSEKNTIEKMPKNRKLQPTPSPMLMLRKLSKGIIVENVKWLLNIPRWGINFSIHLTWAQDNIKVINLKKCQHFKF